MTYSHTFYGIRHYDADGRIAAPTYFGHTDPATCNHAELERAWVTASRGVTVIADWRECIGAAGVDWWPTLPTMGPTSRQVAA